MNYRELGLTGLKIAPVGFGGIPIQRLDQENVNLLIEKLYSEGLNFIDTARGYTTSEEMIGNAMVPVGREHFVIATKSMARTYEDMRADIEKSLSNLKVDVIDLYQCHNVKDIEQYALVMSENGAYKALLEAKADGKIRHIGITAHSADFINQIIQEMPFETIQFPYNIVERHGESLFKVAAQRGIGVIVMKPLAGGAIQNGTLSLKFILSNHDVSVAIPGMDHVDQVAENAAVANMKIDFSKEEILEMNEIVAALGEAFCRRCGYCLPCPQGIDIPTQFLMEGYLTRYHLAEWAVTRYEGLAVKADACVSCGSCETKCPYNLPIVHMLKNVVHQFDLAKSIK
ncbi:aldo/keto reductase [Fusibacter bizertensis]|uniref:Aldo/keto reductase n=1 Tax=Fusibacter bizertensis TaxID=1488331 RepID=A0ABT6NB55_9FIRM|nr:aldo/keto reductase [Fusibacter bizertensis]MDH8677648.1 aldo/keto reductase [Fusibacter bizertensis]